MKLRAFTLIELLVVIAIIGVLSAVVLSSLNTARSKGNDSAVKANLKTILTQSYMYYDTYGNYGTTVGTGTTTTSTAGAACGGASGLFNDTNVVKALQAATNAGGTAVGTNNIGRAGCGFYTSGNNSFWEVAVPLPSNPANSWCVSSNGVSKQITSPDSTVISPWC